MIYTTLTTCRISGVLFAEKPYEKNTRIILLIFFQISTWVRRHKFIKQNNTGLQTGFASLSVTSFVSPCMGGKQQGDLWHRWLTLIAPSDNLCWKWWQLPVMLSDKYLCARLDPGLYYDNDKDFSHSHFNSKRENEWDFFGVGHVILTYSVTTQNSIS